MTRSEFARTSPVAEPATAESVGEAQTQEFLKLRLMYDPYSPNADEDYERLRSELERFDVVGMLARELRKSRIDEVLVRQLVKSLRYLAPELRDAAVGSLMGNLEVLYPLFPTVALVVRALLQDLSDALRAQVFSTLRNLIQSGSHIFLVPANLCFGLRVLVQDPSEETDTLLAQLYESRQTQPMVRRDLILCLARRRVDYRVADLLRRFSALTPWEKRALIPASYVLGDEGAHWRQGIRSQLHPVDQRFMTWVSTKNSGKLWEIPL